MAGRRNYRFKILNSKGEVLRTSEPIVCKSTAVNRAIDIVNSNPDIPNAQIFYGDKLIRSI